MKLTVIIPVYRVEATLDRCVESVLAQAIEDMEVILVDDGSPDNCPTLCDNWAAKDKRISVIHQKNGGLSDARNAGLDVAKGAYITFVDSDDYLTSDTYGPLLDMVSECDVLEYSVADKLSLKDCCYDDTNRYWLDVRAYTHTYAWNKIYKRELFDNVRFPKGKVFEDVFTLPLLLRRSKRVRTTSKGFYHYTQNEQGITATAGGQELAMLLDAHLLSGMPMDDHYYMYLVNIQVDVWERTKAPFMLTERKVKTKGLELKTRLKAITLNTIGIKGLCIINKALHKVKTPSRW